MAEALLANVAEVIDVLVIGAVVFVEEAVLKERNKKTNLILKKIRKKSFKSLKKYFRGSNES